MIDGIYIIVVVCWAALFIGLCKENEDNTLSSLASLAVMVIGVSIAISGFDGVNDLTTKAFAALNFGFGAYTLIKSNIDTIRSIF